MGMSGPQSETHEGAWHDEECGDLECDTATDGIRPDGATSQDRASPVTVSPFSPLHWAGKCGMRLGQRRSETFHLRRVKSCYPCLIIQHYSDTYLFFFCELFIYVALILSETSNR